MSLLLLCLSSFLLAQDEVVVSGRVLDSQTGEVLPYASVAVTSVTDSQLVAGAITGDEGRFSIYGLNQGEYLLTCSYVGYNPSSTSLLIGKLNNIYDLGRISLEPSTGQIEEVTISKQQAIISADMDKKTFRMDDVLAQSGGSVLDALKGLPGVTVDQEGKVILRGSDKVAVLIDNKQSSLTGFGNQKGLDNIPVSNIESIEIINNPSAKYDASGMAGIININYKKEKETGFHGEAGLTAGAGTLTPAKEDLPTRLGSFQYTPKIIPNLNLNYKTGKIRLFILSELLRQKGLPNNEFTTRRYEDGRRGILPTSSPPNIPFLLA